MTTPLDTVKETYNLPTGIAVALITNRPEMIHTVDPATLTPDEVREVLRLLGDLISDRQEARDRGEELAIKIEELEVTLTDYRRNMRQIAESLFEKTRIVRGPR